MCSCQMKGIGKRKNMAKKKTRRRRSIRGLNSSSLQSTATAAVLGGAGAVVMGMILEKVLPAQYVQYTHYAKIAAGVGLAAMSKNHMIQAAGLGAATVGAAAVVSDLTDGISGGVNLLPMGQPSAYVAARQEGGVNVL